MESRAQIPTANASRYLQQLCKHWSHRLDVTFTPLVGRVPFSADASCLLEAAPDSLDLTITAPDGDTLLQLQRVLFDHLKRFAFREELAEPAWS